MLTPELEFHVGQLGVAKSPAYPVETYRELVEHTARLAYANKDQLLFFRGQERDFLNKAGASSFYPSIYRADMLRREEVVLRFKVLERAASQLRHLFLKGRIEGHADLARKKYVQWSLLQHYEVVQTPLLDFSQSTRVACSFAMRPQSDARVFIFVFGLPYVTNRISINSEHDTVVVRLLSISPPSALRPYFQEGYLAGTEDITYEYESKSELDFNHRLIAKFSIPNTREFWGDGLRGLSEDELYPSSDEMKDLCSQIRVDETLEDDLVFGGNVALGEFVAAWTGLERAVMRNAQRSELRILSLNEAIRQLRQQKLLDPWMYEQLDSLRKFRNNVIHGHIRPSATSFDDAIADVEAIRDQLEKNERDRRSLRL